MSLYVAMEVFHLLSDMGHVFENESRLIPPAEENVRELLPRLSFNQFSNLEIEKIAPFIRDSCNAMQSLETSPDLCP